MPTPDSWAIIAFFGLVTAGVALHLFDRRGWLAWLMAVHIFDRPKVRKVFQWKYHNGIIVALWGAVTGMAALGATLDNAAYLFRLGYLFAFAACIWSLGSWLTSDTVERLGRKPKKQRRRAEHYSRKKYLITKWGISTAITGFFVAAVWFVSDIALRKELEQLGGRLLPASDPMPLNCGTGLKPEEAVLLMGNGTSARITFPFMVMASMRFGSLLSIERESDGSIFIPLEIRSPDGKIIVKMDEHGFDVNRNNILKMHRDDRSSLVVVDEYGNEVLNARYMNRQAFRLTGLINYGGQQLPIQFPGISGLCIDTNGIKNAIPVVIP